MDDINYKNWTKPEDLAGLLGLVKDCARHYEAQCHVFLKPLSEEQDGVIQMVLDGNYDGGQKAALEDANGGRFQGIDNTVQHEVYVRGRNAHMLHQV